MSAWPDSEAVTIRPLNRDDLDRVIGIERSCYPYPWTRGIFADCLRVGYCCIALEVFQELVGYSVMSFGPGEAHLLNICIDPEYRRQGYGAFLLEQMISQARNAGAEMIYLEVRPSNSAAIEMYHQRGFHIIGTRPAYYPAVMGREDARLMALNV